MVQLPIAKLASLLIKTLSKPMAKRVKHNFKKNEVSQNFLVNIGQLTHNVTTRMTIWSSGYKVRSIQPLEKEAALSAGADFIGEAFIFGVAGAIVVWEYDKSKKKDTDKELKNLQREKSQQNRLMDLEKRMSRIEQNLAEVVRIHRDRFETIHEPVIKKRRGWLW